MPVSIVVGGQFGSEGKGKIALEVVRRSASAEVAIRVGGPNSGHTVYDRWGRKFVLRQLPGACVDRNVDVVLPSGTYIDPELLLAEIKMIALPVERIFVSREARVIGQEHRKWEEDGELRRRIGSTMSGVGGAVMAAVARGGTNFPLASLAAIDDPRLQDLTRRDVTDVTRRSLDRGGRVVVEGTQGFGLSLLESGYWPKVTSRSTTAAAALSEAGLSPTDVDDVTMVIRSFPIRVAGNSGTLPHETTWETVSRISGQSDGVAEFTTVTGQLRRVGQFDPKVVIRAIKVNQPTRIALNHLDYIDKEEEVLRPNSKIRQFILEVEAQIGRRIDWMGFSPQGVTTREFD